MRAWERATRQAEEEVSKEVKKKKSVTRAHDHVPHARVLISAVGQGR